MSVQADKIKSSLIFKGYRVKKIDFTINDNLKDPIEVKLDFNIKKEVNVDYDNNKAQIILTTLVFEEAEKKQYPFSLKVIVEGQFEFENCNKKQMEAFSNLNAVAILFPYIRAIITNITSAANVNPLILPSINIIKLIENETK